MPSVEGSSSDREEAAAWLETERALERKGASDAFSRRRQAGLDERDTSSWTPIRDLRRSPLFVLLLLASVVVGYLFFQCPTPAPECHRAAPPSPRLAMVSSRKLRVGTFNIRYSPPNKAQDLAKRAAEKPSGGIIYGEKPWADRRGHLVDQIIFSDLDVVGLQEALHHQVQDLDVLLHEEYNFVGVGRDDGKQAGEYVPIFFRKDRFELLSVTHQWLSKTPDIPGSIDWDAGQTRMFTIAHLKDLSVPSSGPIDPDIGPDPFSPQGSSDLYVVNTHWDDRGLQSRHEAAKIIRGYVNELRRKEAGEPKLVLLLGDLNSPPDEGGYQELTGGRYAADPPPTSSMDSSSPSFFDSRHELLLRSKASPKLGLALHNHRFGENTTFTGFTDHDTQGVIDVVLPFDNGAVVRASETDKVGKGGRRWIVRSYGVLPNAFEGSFGGHLVSDHRLVVAAFELV